VSSFNFRTKPSDVEGRRGAGKCGNVCCGKKGGREGSLEADSGEDKDGDGEVEADEDVQL
jgi:hypothetical protein